MTLTGELTDAQEDAIRRLEKKLGPVQRSNFDQQGRFIVYLPGTESPRRRRRFITPSGVVERGS